MLDNDYRAQETELVKLISFGFDLHKDELDYWGEGCDLFPRLYTYNHDSYKTKRVNDGIVWGRRGYSSHSTGEVYTNLGLTIGKIKNKKLIFDYAIMFGIDTFHENLNITLFECKDKKTYEPALSPTLVWNKLSEEERIDLFVKSMVSIGFNKEDVIAVMNGKMTAREAFIHVAPEAKKHLQWVDYGRRHFEFYDNIAIDGHFGNVFNLDDFPFPFDGEVIIDCSKAKTACINLKDTVRKVRLINVNQNRDSLRFANIRNAIIDEVIDLSKVDAYDTVFGHHKVCGFEYSIAKIDTMDLTLATDSNGNKLKVDKDGKAEVNYFGEPTIIEQTDEKKEMQVLANVDSIEMIEQVVATSNCGVGLVRTETKIYEQDFISKFYPVLFEEDLDQELVEEFKREYSIFLDEIFKNFIGKRIVIRLFDFRFKDVLRVYYPPFDYKNFTKIRGTKYLYHNKEFLRILVDVILELASKYEREVDILVPYVEKETDLVEVREVIEEENESIGAEYRYGAMIENATSIDKADLIAKRVDFVSIGLNDLTESLTGKSRESESTEFYYLNDELKEAIKEIIYRVKAGNPNITIGICGEHTNNVENIDFFLEAGVDYLSVNPITIPAIRNKISKSTHTLKLVRTSNQPE